MTKTANLHAGPFFWNKGGANARSVSRRPHVLLFAALLFFVIGGSLVYVWSRIQVIQAGYEISNALKAGRTLAEESKRLRVEVATLKSYARVERFATQELGMSKPKPGQVIIIR